jgi:hypothetical protein
MAIEKFSIDLDKFICPSSKSNNYTENDVDLLLLYKHYLNGWLSLPVIILGIMANSVAISALLHRYLRNSSTNAYLMALSLSNLISLVCLLLMVGVRFTLVHPYRLIYCKHWYENWISLAIPILTPINHLFQLSGKFLIFEALLKNYLLHSSILCMLF